MDHRLNGLSKRRALDLAGKLSLIRADRSLVTVRPTPSGPRRPGRDAAGVDLRTYLLDVLQRIAKTSDVRELTPYGWKETWAKVVQDHRASIIERLLVASQA